MASWDLLDEKDELELHKARLLAVEERPFKRITKRFVALNTLPSSRGGQQPTPPPGDGDVEASNTSPTKDAAVVEKQLREELTLDFAAFDSSIARLQLLLNANARERDRYTTSRQRILDESDAVKAHNSQLRKQLDEARETLAQRKKFDELADRITSNRMLRPREEQQASLRQLDEECRELEAESARYAETWRERRAQFERIMEEGMLLRRQIRDEKEEVERREGMEGDEELDGQSAGGRTPKHVPNGTGSGNATPRREAPSGGRTPTRDSQDGALEGSRLSLKDRPVPLGGLSQNGSRAASRDPSPRRDGKREDSDDEIEEGEDIDMGETGEVLQDSETPLITIDRPEDSPSDDKMEVDTT